jgi:hypothetical protein
MVTKGAKKKLECGGDPRQIPFGFALSKILH